MYVLVLKLVALKEQMLQSENKDFKMLILGVLFFVSFALHGQDQKISQASVDAIKECAKAMLNFGRNDFFLRVSAGDALTDKDVFAWVLKMAEAQHSCLQKDPALHEALGRKRHLAHHNALKTMQLLARQVHECRSRVKEEVKDLQVDKHDQCPALVMLQMLAQADEEQAEKMLEQRLRECDGMKGVEKVIWR